MSAVIEVEHLSARYGHNVVVQDVSFRMKPGEVLALLGHNGCGKTTLLKSILGLNRGTQGHILLDGERIDPLPASARIDRGLRLLQGKNGVFAPLTVAENLNVVAERNCTPGCRMSVSDVLDLFPILADRQEALAGDLSGGQQQMLSLCMALLGSPRCLLLDEPSIGLAPALVSRTFALVQKVCHESGLAAILVEQNVAASLKIADHVIILNSGAIVFDAPPEEARNTDLWAYF